MSATLFSLYACNKDTDEQETIINSIKNSSHHDIVITINSEKSTDTIRIPSGSSKEYKYLYKNGTFPYPFNGDSLIISYDDTLSVIHFNPEKQIVARNIYSDMHRGLSIIDD